MSEALVSRDAEWWRRIAAFTLDAALTMGAAIVLASSVGPYSFMQRGDGFMLWWPVVAGAYFTLLIGGRGGQTLGKLVLGTRVTRTDGRPVGYGRAFARWVLTLVLWVMTYWIGAVIDTVALLVDPRRRSIHDRLVDTVVVRASAVQRKGEPGQHGSPLEFRMFGSRRQMAGWLIGLGVLFCVSAVVLITAAMSVEGGSAASVPVWQFVAILVLLWSVAVLVVIALDQTITLTGEGFRRRTTFSDTFYRWSEIAGFEPAWGISRPSGSSRGGASKPPPAGSEGRVRMRLVGGSEVLFYPLKRPTEDFIAMLEQQRKLAVQ